MSRFFRSTSVYFVVKNVYVEYELLVEVWTARTEGGEIERKAAAT